ncbi:MAG: hypothetical protein D6703_00475 [Zetaproteobacteria bacterium]|nr:MAG: hypothetical protein D6703_00475 [Zetaproteobacteria bacterium]
MLDSKTCPRSCITETEHDKGLIVNLVTSFLCHIPGDSIAIRNYGLFAARRWLEERGYERIRGEGW